MHAVLMKTQNRSEKVDTGRHFAVKATFPALTRVQLTYKIYRNRYD